MSTVKVTTALTWVKLESNPPGEGQGTVLCLTANGKLIVMNRDRLILQAKKYAVEWWAAPQLP